MLSKKKYIVTVFALLLAMCFTFGCVKANDLVINTEEKVNSQELTTDNSKSEIMTINLQEENTKVEETEDVKKDETEKDDIKGTFDTSVVDGVYKYSENKLSSYLPFVRFATGRIIIDKEIQNNGFNFSSQAIEVNAKTKGVQVLFSSDTIRINAPMEYGVIFANGNVIIDSDIDRSLVVFSTGTVTVTEKAKLSEDLLCVCTNLELKGTVEGSVIGSIESANITGKINKDLRGTYNDITFSANDNVEKNIYINTYNEKLNVKEKYPNAVLNVIKVEATNEFSFAKIMNMIFTSLILALLYLLINKVSKKQAFETALNKVKANPVMVILSGAVMLLASIPLTFLLIMISAFGLWIIAIPILLVYIVALIIIYILMNFIIGSLMYTYIKNKYLKEGGAGTDILGTFCMFLLLNILVKLPLIGGYILLALYILATGCAFTIIFSKKK